MRTRKHRQQHNIRGDGCFKDAAAAGGVAAVPPSSGAAAAVSFAGDFFAGGGAELAAVVASLPGAAVGSDNSPSLLQLPDPVLAIVLEHLSFADRHAVTRSLCRSLRADEQRCRHLDSLIRRVAVAVPGERDAFQSCYLHRATNLLELDLGAHCTDDFLFSLAATSPSGAAAVGVTAENCPLPNLRSISMVSSGGVTDQGLIALSQGGSARSQNLQYVNLTFCHKTTYQGTFCLRDSLTNLKVIRRQPEWVDGRYETPFEDDGLHTYYADGTFEFERSNQSRGFVVEIEQWSNASYNSQYFLRDKLQYSNFEAPPRWPDWAKYCYRPGVSLLRINNDDIDDAGNTGNEKNDVLVAQTLRGIKPPPNYPRPEHVQILRKPKTTCHFDRDGNLLLPDEGGDDHDRGHDGEDHQQQQQRDSRRHFMVSRMRVFPLQTLMPPADVVEQNREFCASMKAHWIATNPTTFQFGESAIHEALS